MAERRMFARTIVDSDAFVDMPLSAQALYFHLAIRGDDDGFINNPKRIQRMIGASDDDLKILALKKFIIPFESGIVVIKHWKIHNYIRGDRKKNTVYPKEMSLLYLKENGSYALKSDSVAVIKGHIEETIKDSSEDLISDTHEESLRQKAYRESPLPYSFDYKIRQAFFGDICPVCGATMVGYDGNDLRRPSIQHNVPISKGGKHELGNISVICRHCNISLRDKETGSLNADKVIEKWDKIYTSVKCQSLDGQLTGKCQHRLDKDKLVKVSIGKGREGKESAPTHAPTREDTPTHPPTPTAEDVIHAYNDACVRLPPLRYVTEVDRDAARSLLSSFSLDQLKEAFAKAEASDLLSARKEDAKWRADFAWVATVDHIRDLLNGKYDTWRKEKPNRQSGASFDADEFYKKAIDHTYGRDDHD